MQQHERHRCARDRRAAASLTDIADQIHTSRHLVDAAFMAAHDLPDDQKGALTALLDIISGKLTQAAEALDCRAQKNTTDAA